MHIAMRQANAVISNAYILEVYDEMVVVILVAAKCFQTLKNV